MVTETSPRYNCWSYSHSPIHSLYSNITCRYSLQGYRQITEVNVLRYMVGKHVG